MAIGSYRERGSRQLRVWHALLPNLGYPANGWLSQELTLVTPAADRVERQELVLRRRKAPRRDGTGERGRTGLRQGRRQDGHGPGSGAAAEQAQQPDVSGSIGPRVDS
jgi:hypothetical protein